MLTVHHLGLSQSERVVWLCEELELDYSLVRYDRRADNRLAPDDYKALHPMGIAPVVSDGPLVLGESGAILDYIDRRHGGGRFSPDPADADFAEQLFWFHWSNGTFMASRMLAMVLKLAGAGAVPFVDDRVARSRDLVERRLAAAPFFGGDRLTLADFMMVYSLTTSRAFGGGPLSDMPATQGYLRRIAQRPGYVRTMAKAEPGMAPMID